MEMDSSSKTTEVGSTEDIVLALLEYLVDPLLPLKSTSAHVPPSLSQQESVAKQVHATVLLYNYYQRKCHPELQFLDFESFCKLAVKLRPSLMLHMKSTHQCDLSKLDDLENQLSVTEKAVMNACSISRTLLDASEDILSSLKEWPIIKVAVLLIDSTKENCVLLFNSITNGVWSLIEKDLDSKSIPVGSKRKRFKISKPCLFKEHGADDEAAFQHVALSAVKEKTGINGSELKVLESKVVYTLSKEKTAARFYIVQSAQAISEDLQVPIKDAIDSLQGPFVSKMSGSWIVTPVVEYFNLLPYAGIMSDWFSREVLLNNLNDRAEMGTVDINMSRRSDKPFEQKLSESNGVFSNTLHNVKVGLDSAEIDSLNIDKPCDNEVIETRDGSDKTGTTLDVGQEPLVMNLSEAMENPCDKDAMEPGHCSDKEASVSIQSPEQKNGDGSPMISLSNSTSGTHSIDIDENPVVFPPNSVVCPPKDNINERTPGAIKVYQYQKRRTPSTLSSESRKNASTNGMKIQAEVATDLKMEVADLKTESCISECRDERVDTEKMPSVVSPNIDETQKVDHSLVPFEPKINYEEKVQVTIASKETALSQTALRVLIRKRETLSNQLQKLEDEMAVCERNIQAILNGAENALAIKLEAVLDCCNEVCLQSSMEAQCRMNHDADNQGLHQYPTGKRLSEAILPMRTPCQELNTICCANNWMLPMYRVAPSDGGFLANVTVKGLDFECSGGSDLHPSPREARDSAATQMIAKLQSMASQIQ